ncbi:hypothetical protein HDU67_003639 [Dinochytrium kinnereticum]|nr:hypothetical protein HDU67_003639 [Dinochytrium kinnereticum]
MSQTQSEGRGDRFQRAAVVSMQQGSVATALSLIEKAIKAEPKNIYYYEFRATIYMTLEKMDDAFINAEIMIKLDPKGAKGYLLAGKLLRIQGLLHEALQVYFLGTSKVSKYDPGYAKLKLYNEELKKHLGVEDKENKTEEEKGKESIKATSLRKKLRASTDVSSIKKELHQEDRNVGESGAGNKIDTPSVAAKPIDDTRSLLDLPAEVLIEVCKLLNTKKLCRLLAVNSKLKRFLTTHPSLWADLEFCPSGSSSPKALTPASVVNLIRHGNSKIKKLILGHWPGATPGVLKVLRKYRPNLTRFELCGTRNIPCYMLAADVCTMGSRLSVLNLDWTDMGDRQVSDILEHCRDLLELSLRHCNLTQSAFRVPEGTSLKLKKLFINGCSGISASAVGAIAKVMPDLEDLDLTECSRVNANVFQHLGHLRSLQSISLTKTAIVENSATELIEQLNYFAASLPEIRSNLRSFRLSSCPALNDAALSILARSCPFLTVLDISTSANVSGDGVDALGMACPRLQKLNLANCFRVSGDSVFMLIRACRSLEALDVSQTRVDDTFLRDLANADSSGENIRELHLRACSRITGSGVVSFVRRVGRGIFPLLRLLSLDRNAQISNEHMDLVRAAASSSLTTSCRLAE